MTFFLSCGVFSHYIWYLFIMRFYHVLWFDDFCHIWWLLSYMRLLSCMVILIIHDGFYHTWKDSRIVIQRISPNPWLVFSGPGMHECCILWSMEPHAVPCMNLVWVGYGWIPRTTFFLVFFLLNFPFGDSALLECQSTMQSRCAWARKLFVTLDPCAWIVHDFESSLKR